MKELRLHLPSLAFGPNVAMRDLFTSPIAAEGPRRIEHVQAASKPQPLPRFKSSDVTRAINAVCKAGQTVTGTEISRDGTIRIIHGDGIPASDRSYDTWKAKRGADQA